MSHIKYLVLILALPSLLVAQADSDIWKKYNSLKDDGDLYVGEGIARLSEFAGDKDKALQAARTRARAELSSAIRVRVSSVTTETMQGGKDGVKEELKSSSRESTDTEIENVKLREFIDFPSEGKLTVLSYVSKEDYRRQVAGKGTRVYHSQNGLRLGIWGLSLGSVDSILNSGQNQPTDHPISGGGGSGGGGGGYGSGGGGSSGGGNSSGHAPGFALEFIWRGFVASLNFQVRQTSLYVFVPDASGGTYNQLSSSMDLALSELGYDWEPFNWRLQPFFPLRLALARSSFYEYQAVAAGAGAGLGLRYWPTDSFSFELSIRGMLGFGSSAYTKDGAALRLRENQDATLSLTGTQTQAAITWSGF